jgi:hypothetical protein
MRFRFYFILAPTPGYATIAAYKVYNGRSRGRYSQRGEELTSWSAPEVRAMRLRTVRAFSFPRPATRESHPGPQPRTHRGNIRSRTKRETLSINAASAPRSRMMVDGFDATSAHDARCRSPRSVVPFRYIIPRPFELHKASTPLHKLAMFESIRITDRFVAHPRHSFSYGCGSLRALGARSRFSACTQAYGAGY